MKHRQGTKTWADGDKYVGEWNMGKEHGQGTKTSADGDKYVGEWKDGKKDGLARAYLSKDSDEYLSVEENWKNGLRDGYCKTFYTNGNIHWSGQSIKDKKEGYWYAYSSSGKNQMSINYKNGIQTQYREYYENRRLRLEINSKDGEPMSKKCWNKKGKEIDCEKLK